MPVSEDNRSLYMAYSLSQIIGEEASGKSLSTAADTSTQTSSNSQALLNSRQDSVCSIQVSDQARSGGCYYMLSVQSMIKEISGMA